jgi:hypothetical protein
VGAASQIGHYALVGEDEDLDAASIDSVVAQLVRWRDLDEPMVEAIGTRWRSTTDLTRRSKLAECYQRLSTSWSVTRTRSAGSTELPRGAG